MIVSLRRMNRVLEINEDSAYAVVEPGVRWFDLYDALRAGGHKLMVSIPDLGWGSVVGNTLENGATYLPPGSDMAAACGMEVVLRERRGAEDRHGGDAGQPGVARVQAQPRPLARHALHAVELRDRHEDGRLADAARRSATCRSGSGSGTRTTSHRAGRDAAACSCSTRTIENVPQIWNTIALRLGDVLAARSGTRARSRSRTPVIDTMARELEVGRWMMRFALYGDEAVVDHRFRKVKEAFERIPGAEVWGAEARAGRVRGAREPARARPGRRPEPRASTR